MMTPPANQTHTWQTTASDADQRLDLAIGSQLGLSRQQVKTLLEQGAVQLDGRKQGLAAKGKLLHTGQTISVNTPQTPGQWQVIAQPEMDLNVLEAGEDYLLLEKPAGMAVHPLKPDETGTLLNAVIARFPQMQGVGEGGLRSGVVHRLDVETSGVIIMASTQQRWESLRQAFAEHRTQKHYTAVVAGQPVERGGAKLHLKVTRHAPAYVSVLASPEQGSRACDLSWTVTQRLRNASVINIRLGTGFLHQIRVMMAHLGCPVLGDAVYGDAAVEHDQQPIAPRLMLHAHSLEVEGSNATSPLPTSMQRFIDALASSFLQ